MKTFPKIETIYDRDEDFKVIVGKHRRPEYGYINQWVVTEKIDGTNIRVWFGGIGDDLHWEVRGKSDSAQIPPVLHDSLLNWCSQNIEAVRELMAEHRLEEFMLFGEGYGPKIQNGGYYRKDQGFILFDILVDDTVWLSPEAVMNTAVRLGLSHVPCLGVVDEQCILDMVLEQFPSLVAEEKRPAEGVVCRTITPLYDNRGERVIWKLKGRDFARPRT